MHSTESKLSRRTKKQENTTHNEKKKASMEIDPETTQTVTVNRQVYEDANISVFHIFKELEESASTLGDVRKT